MSKLLNELMLFYLDDFGRDLNVSGRSSASVTVNKLLTVLACVCWIDVAASVTLGPAGAKPAHSLCNNLKPQF